MSRFRRIIHGAASGYAVLVVTALYSLASVPLALHYLSKERFALWALMSSIGGYLNLIDFGMSGSVARLLIDHKDTQERGAYGSLIKTGWLVLAVQGTLLLLAGLALAPILGELLNIPPELTGEFVRLMRWQTAALALMFFLRISNHLLYAHQRLDVLNYLQMGTLGANFALLWFFFHAGQGVFSLAWANLLGCLGGGLLSLAVCRWLALFPSGDARGRASWASFNELFSYGKDLFLVAVGTQLIMASQTLIITRWLGLGVAAAWSVGTRAFTLVSQMVWRIADVSGPALSEMLVRGEEARLRERYQALVTLTASLSGFAAVGYALCNAPFVALWTQHQFAWPAGNDVLLGAWLIVLAILHCHNSFVLLIKTIGFMRYVYFVEGLIFVTASVLVARRGGLPAVIACSLACSTLFSGTYGVWRVSRYFRCSLYEVGLTWLAPMARALALFVPAAIAVSWISGHLDDPLARLVFNASLSGSLGFYFFLRYGLPGGIQREVLQRVPRAISPLLRRVLVGARR